MVVGSKIMLKKAEAHLYTVIKVARGVDLRKQVGKNIYFDLVDHDKVRSFQILKQSPFNLFKEEYSKALGIPVESQCFWIWSKRQNQSYRPDRRLTPEEEAQSVGELSDRFDKMNKSELKLFLETECRQDYHLPPPNKGEKDILLFFKLYDPEEEQLRYVGRLFVKSFDKPIEILTKLNALAGFASDEEIQLFEEIRFEPKVVCKRLDMTDSFEANAIKDGDIICFQKRPATKIEEQVPFPYVSSFLEHMKSYQLQAEKEKEIIVPQSVPQEESCFMWTIRKFTNLNVIEHYSDVFVIGKHEWRIIIFPKGNPARDQVDHLAIYIEIVDSGNLPREWSKYTTFSLAVINQIDSEKTIKHEEMHVFNQRSINFGFSNIMPLSELSDPSKGFVVNDTIIIEADVEVHDDIQPKKTENGLVSL